MSDTELKLEIEKEKTKRVKMVTILFETYLPRAILVAITLLVSVTIAILFLNS